MGRALNNARELVNSSLSDLRISEIRLAHADDPVKTAGALAGARFDAQNAVPPGLQPGDGPYEAVEALQKRRAEYVANAEAVERNRQKLAQYRRELTKSSGGSTPPIITGQLTGWAAVSQSLSDYAKDAQDTAKGVGGALRNAFQGAENAFRRFVTTGKLDFKGLVRSILADLAVLQFKKAVLGPISDALAGAFGGGGGGFGGGGGAGSGGGFGKILGSIFHDGGTVGAPTGRRAVPALAFAGAPRIHDGGWVGLRPGEVAAILQRGERVQSRRELAELARAGTGADGGVTIHIDARGAQMGVAEQIERKFREVLPEIRRGAVQSVANRRFRGHAS